MQILGTQLPTVGIILKRLLVFNCHYGLVDLHLTAKVPLTGLEDWLTGIPLISRTTDTTTLHSNLFPSPATMPNPLQVLTPEFHILIIILLAPMTP